MYSTDRIILSADTFLKKEIIDTSLALTVTGAKGRFAEVKAKLVKLYGEDVPVNATGAALCLKDVQAADEITLPPLPDFDKPRYNVLDAARVIDRLMQRPGGCPWDSVQTHESIRINMIEEAYEAVDAIDNHDLENMTEEFGDVLLQSLLQSAIARREGEFDFNDVCDGLCKKLISRHTFIFGGDSAGNADDAITLWEKNKAAEKHYTSVKSQLEKLPQNFPSLLYAQKVHKKSKKGGVAVDAARDYEQAVAAKDYAALIAAAAALLADGGKDAEVELNKLIKSKIEKL